MTIADSNTEYLAALQGAVIFDRSDSGKIEAVGPEAAAFLHNLCTNDVRSLQPGKGCFAYMTTGQAKIVAIAQVFRPHLPTGREMYCLDVGTGMGPKIAAHLNRYFISERLELADRTAEYAQIHIAGPRSADILGKVFGKPVDLPAQLDNHNDSIGEITCEIRRHDRLGLGAYDIVFPFKDLQTVFLALRQAGATDAGMETYQTLRIEAGTPEYGLDVDETNLPQEVGRIDQTVSFTKGCYIGQETVARIRTYGHVNRALSGLVVEGPRVVPGGARIVSTGQEVGSVTSSVYSPRLGKVIALGYLRRGHQEAGTKLEIEASGERWSAEVSGLPFISSPV